MRLESEYPLSDMTQRVLAKRLKLKRNQIYNIGMPLDMGYAFALPSLVPADVREDLVDVCAWRSSPALSLLVALTFTPRSLTSITAGLTSRRHGRPRDQ